MELVEICEMDVGERWLSWRKDPCDHLRCVHLAFCVRGWKYRKIRFPDIAPGFGPARVSRLTRFTHLGGVTHDAHEGKSAGRGRFGGAAARPCTRGPPRETRDSILEDVSEHEF